ncbi:MAG: DNA-processing protein DprA [Acidiferrobacteraceae bacterium]
MSVISPATRVLLTLSMLKGVGPASLRKVAAIPDFLGEKPTTLGRQVSQIARSLETEDAWHLACEKAERQIEAVEMAQARVISAADPEYPRRLAATKDDPFILYVKGKLAPDGDHSVAIIGTREPTAHGIQIAQRVSKFFAEKRSSIVSGLALGCDAVAHETALQCGGHTVAVLAHGLQTISPSKHKELAERILESGGALVSEYPFGQSAQAQQFVKRDKTQAGLADGVVMIQSDLKGGSLHASRATLEYGRWLAVPYPTDRDRANNEPKIQANLLIADGAPGPKTDLLRCDEFALSRIVVLRSKEDYRRLLEADPASAALVESVPGNDEEAFVQGSARLDSMPALQHVEPDDAGDKPYSMMTASHVSSVRESVESNVILHIRWKDQKALSVSDALATIEKFKSTASSTDAALAIDLAYRLRFLQKELEEISKLRSVGSASEEKSMFLQFSVENAWWQMKNVADSTAHSYFKTWIGDRNAIAHSPEDRLSFFQHAAETTLQKSMEEIFSLLRADLAAAVIESRSSNIVRQHSPFREVDFDDLVCWFNASLSIPSKQHEDSP